MFKTLFVKIKLRIRKLKERRKLNRLKKRLFYGAMFLKVMNQELKKQNRDVRKQWLNSLYKDNKLSDQIVDYCMERVDLILAKLDKQIKQVQVRKKQDKKLQKSVVPKEKLKNG